MNTTPEITGHEAIRLSESDGTPLYCYANPLDRGGEVSIDLARQIVREDASLIYIKPKIDASLPQWGVAFYGGTPLGWVAPWGEHPETDRYLEGYYSTREGAEQALTAELQETLP